MLSQGSSDAQRNLAERAEQSDDASASSFVSYAQERRAVYDEVRDRNHRTTTVNLALMTVTEHEVCPAHLMHGRMTRLPSCMAPSGRPLNRLPLLSRNEPLTHKVLAECLFQPCWLAR